jgi:aldehyde dehydrogenase
MERVVERAKQIKRGSPLDPECMVGAQASKEQYDKILSYIEIGQSRRRRGAARRWSRGARGRT